MNEKYIHVVIFYGVLSTAFSVVWFLLLVEAYKEIFGGKNRKQ